MSSDFNGTGYRVIRKLGGGAVAEVFLAEPEAGGAQVVLKVLRPQLTADAGVVGRFLDESRVCQQISHANILRHLSAGRLPDGRVFLVTEYLDGVDLKEHLRRNGKMGAKELIELMVPLCDALLYVHSRSIIHRDIKPQNVFLQKTDTGFCPKLLDFGLAHFRGNKTVQTVDGAILASPEYTPPECVQGVKADARSDLYALGILMYEALTGAPPFTSDNYAEMLLMHMHEEPAPLTGDCAHLNPVVMRCLAKAPADRFQDASELAAALVESADPNNVPSTKIRTMPEPLPLTEPVPGEVQPGERVGSYELVKRIGEGAMGTVFLARHVKLGRQVAIKILKPEHSRDATFVQRFFQEARTVNEIKNDHIVDIQDFSDLDQDGPVYCVMELLTGLSLARLIEEGPLPISRAVNLTRQLCSALGAAHAAGVVHRDIKPDNIFVTERSGISDYVKVLDFGVAKLLTPIGELAGGGTIAGAIIGTPTYMAPEQASGLPSDHRVDVYAVGTVLYEMLAGRPPFDAQVFGQLVVQLTTQPPPPLPDRVPSGLKALVLKCLEKDPNRRPQSMFELAELLRPFATPTLTSQPEDAESLPVLAKSRAPLLFLGSLAAVLLVGLSIAFVQRRHAARAAPPPAPVAAAEPSPEPEAVEEEEPPSAEQEVMLDLRSDPAGATVVRMDSGAELGLTPLSLPVTRLDAPVVLRFSLPGHRSHDEEVRFAGNVAMMVQLTPERREVVKTKRGSKRAFGKKGISRDAVIDPFGT